MNLSAFDSRVQIFLKVNEYFIGSWAARAFQEWIMQYSQISPWRRESLRAEAENIKIYQNVLEEIKISLLAQKSASCPFEAPLRLSTVQRVVRESCWVTRCRLFVQKDLIGVTSMASLSPAIPKWGCHLNHRAWHRGHRRVCVGHRGVVTCPQDGPRGCHTLHSPTDVCRPPRMANRPLCPSLGRRYGLNSWMVGSYWKRSSCLFLCPDLSTELMAQTKC